jgi:hypothetical protein
MDVGAGLSGAEGTVVVAADGAALTNVSDGAAVGSVTLTGIVGEVTFTGIVGDVSVSLPT